MSDQLSPQQRAQLREAYGDLELPHPNVTECPNPIEVALTMRLEPTGQTTMICGCRVGLGWLEPPKSSAT